MLVPPDAQPGGYSATVTVTDRRQADTGPACRSACSTSGCRLRRPLAGQPAHRLPRRARVVREQGRPALPSRLERGALGREREALLVPRRLPDLAGRVGLRRAAYASGLHLLAQVVARRRREHGEAEPRVVRRRCGSRSRTSARAPATGSPASRRSRSTRGATTSTPCAVFWDAHGWLDGHLSYLYTLDEPGPEGMRLVAQQAATAHRCWAGLEDARHRQPEPRRNRFLWDGKDGDDVDIWAVLSRRLLRPVQRSAREAAPSIAQARRAGKMIWSATYTGVGGSPGYSAAEPLSDPRMFLLWNALEGIQGTLYAQGMTSYTPGNPLDAVAAERRVGARLPRRRRAGGERPAGADPRRDRGLGRARRSSAGSAAPAAVRTILANAGLFSATAGGSSSPARSAASCTARPVLVAAVVARRVDRRRRSRRHTSRRSAPPRASRRRRLARPAPAAQPPRTRPRRSRSARPSPGRGRA